MNLTLWVSAALVAASAVLALVFGPRAAPPPSVADMEEEAPYEMAA
jgi:hypothetical protein